MVYKRTDGRKADEMREIRAEVGVVPRADGSALFAFGDTIAIAAVYGPKQFHPQHLQNPEKGTLRCTYDMLSWSVSERKRPGPSRRSSEISKVISWALSPVVQLDAFPSTVIDLFVYVLQAAASTRCAGINAATMALAHAGVPMSDFVSAVSVGSVDDSIVVDMTKDEEDVEGATDIPLAFLNRSGKVSLFQLDGKVSAAELKEAVRVAREACKKICERQKSTLKAIKAS